MPSALFTFLYFLKKSFKVVQVGLELSTLLQRGTAQVSNRLITLPNTEVHHDCKEEDEEMKSCGLEKATEGPEGGESANNEYHQLQYHKQFISC